MTLQALIDKQDNFEIIRDQIAAILVNEVANQMNLATLDGKDPALWKLRIYSERSNPWEAFRGPPDAADTSPVVNIWYDADTAVEGSSNTTKRQRMEGTFNLDCYGYGLSEADGAGHKPGDRSAVFEAHRALRLVRNILMAAENTYLQLRGTVGQRWTQGRTVFQPEQGTRPVEHIVGARLALRVQFNEVSPQTVGETIETLAVTVRRAEDGEILLEAEYTYPIP
jgi:hypothetical protein